MGIVLMLINNNKNKIRNIKFFPKKKKRVLRSLSSPPICVLSRLTDELHEACLRLQSVISHRVTLGVTPEYSVRVYISERLAHVFLHVFESCEVAGVAFSIFRRLDE